MKKTILLVALAAAGMTAMAQAERPAADKPASMPAKIVLLKKVDAEPTAAPASKSAPNGDGGAEAALRLPAPVLRARSQELPGLGVMPGEQSDMRIKSIRVGSDRNELVYISQGQLNKISTPFEQPQIIDSTGATIKAVGQDIFLQPSSDKPLTVYITNGGQGQSIGITLVPKVNLPAQTIVLQSDAPTGAPAVKAEVEEIVASDYVSRINGLIKAMALGQTPQGFTRSRLPVAVVAGKDVVMEPQYKYAGTTYDLYSYRVRSTSTSPLELKEDAFYTEAVRAVAFYPSALLQQGEETSVFVIADRPAQKGAAK